MWPAAVDDVGRLDAAGDRLEARRELRPHPAGHALERRADLVDAGPRDERGGVGRVGEPAEVAALICWLASEEMSFSTGATYDISGGRATY